MKPLETISIRVRMTSLLLALLTSGVVLGATVGGMIHGSNGGAASTVMASAATAGRVQ